MNETTILVLGTADTKAAELSFIAETLREIGAIPRIMDVGILGAPQCAVDYHREAVAEAAGTTNQQIAALGNEHLAMMKQAEGARLLSLSLVENNEIDGVLAIGGTMATDLALEVTAALPFGFPKFIVSTVAFSPLLPAERIGADVMMALWAGGLHGLNPLCRSVLRHSCAAVVGASRHRMTEPTPQSAMIGMTSLGGSSLRYMKPLASALTERGYETAVFHSTGMGGVAFEFFAKQQRFAAVMDFCLIEISNYLQGSVVNAGAQRMESAGTAGVPQIIAPGGITLVDIPAWCTPPEKLKDREIHTHNRLIACASLSAQEKRAAAIEICRKLESSSGPTAFILPLGGIDEWDRKGGPFHDPEGHELFCREITQRMPKSVEFHPIDGHLNDQEFSDTALAIFDRWVASGTIGNPRAHPSG